MLSKYLLNKQRKEVNGLIWMKFSTIKYIFILYNLVIGCWNRSAITNWYFVNEGPTSSENKPWNISCVASTLIFHEDKNIEKFLILKIQIDFYFLFLPHLISSFLLFLPWTKHLLYARNFSSIYVLKGSFMFIYGYLTFMTVQMSFWSVNVGTLKYFFIPYILP